MAQSNSRRLITGRAIAIALILSVALVASCGICVAVFMGSSGEGYLSSECKEAIYDNVRLSNADAARRFYVGTKLEDWSQAQLAAAIDEGGYLENIAPCNTEVRGEFDGRGYKW